MAFSFDALTQCFVKKDGHLWKVPVRSVSFDQKIQQEVIEHNRMPSDITGVVNVSSEGVENVFTAPAEWEITTHAKTFLSSGSGTGKVSHSAGVSHSVEEVLWDCFESGTGSFEALADSITLTQSTYTPANIDTNTNCYLNPNYVVLRPIAVGSQNALSGTRLNWLVKYGAATIPRAYVSGGQALAPSTMRSISEDQFSGLCYFVREQSDWNEEFGIRYRPNIYVFVPLNSDGTTQSVPDFIDANGNSNFTVAATSITTTNFSGFNADTSRKTYLAALKDDNYIRNEVGAYIYKSTLDPVLRTDTLGTFDLYFVTNTPAASGLAGTVNANNRVVYQKAYKEGTQYNIDHSINRSPGFHTTVVPGGRLLDERSLVLDSVHHDGYFTGATAGWNAGWEYNSSALLSDGGYTNPTKLTTHGNFSNLRVNDVYPPNTFVFPSKITRNNVDFAVNATNKTWSDGTSTFNAPAMAFSISDSGRIQAGSIVLKQGTEVNFAANGIATSNNTENSSLTLGFQRGDQLVFASTTQATNATGGVAAGTELGEEVRFLVSNVGYEKYRPSGYRTQIINFDQEHTNAFTSLDIDTKDYFATFYDNSTGTTHNLTRNPNKLIYSRTTSEIATTASNRVHTLTAGNAAITVGSRVEHNSLEGSLFVTAISGTSITFHTSVSLADGDVLSVIVFPDYFGLSAGEFMLHEDDMGRISILVRNPLGTSSITTTAADAGHEDVLSVFESTAGTKDGGRVFKVKNCVMNNATISMALDEFVSITWDGFASTLLNQADDFAIQSNAPSTPFAGQIHYDLDNDEVKIRNTANSAWVDCFTEGAESTTGYIHPKLSGIKITQQKTLGLANLPTSPREFGLNNFNNFVEQNTATPLVYDTIADGFSGLSSVSGFTRNVARKVLDTYLASEHEELTPSSVDYALTIDGTTYNTASGHFKGVTSYNKDNNIIKNLRSSTTFGDFVILSSLSTPDTYSLQLLFCTGSDSNYNTAAKLDIATINLEIILPTETKGKEFSPRLISASIELSNNLEMIIPNVLGANENRTIGHIRGKRTCTFSAGMYSDEAVSELSTYLENNGRNELYNEESFTTPSEFQVSFKFGDQASPPGSNTLSMLQVISERSVLNIPSTSTGDVFETVLEGVCPSGTPAVYYIPK